MTAEKQVHRIPELDGFRVLMVFLVSMYHFWQQSWLTPALGSYSLDYLVRAGYMPVDGTILLSGFLLFLPYAQQKNIPTPRQFYRKRIMRIAPSYYFVMLLILFAVALPNRQYASVGQAATDLAAHAAFVSPFFYATYYGTHLGGAAWTVMIEVQMYLLFPLLAQWASKKPAATLLGMAAVAAYARLYFLTGMSSYHMVVNQLISFLDVYAIGMGCALVYVRLREGWERWPRKGLRELAATGVLALGFGGFLMILRAQAYRSFDTTDIQAGQMLFRPLLAVALGAVVLSLPFCWRPIRFLFGNRLMGWLAGISMNYYLIHQTIAVELRRYGIPPSISPQPNVDGERTWQIPYLALCYGVSFLLAVLITYLVEKPGGKWLGKVFAAMDRKK